MAAVQTLQHWNVRDIVNKNCEYLEAIKIKSEHFYLDDVYCYLVFCPLAINSNIKYSCFYLVMNAKDNDQRKVEVSFECASNCSFRTGSIQKFKQNQYDDDDNMNGSLFRLKEIENNPKIQCQIKIYCDYKMDEKCLNESMEKLKIEAMDEDHHNNDYITLIITNNKSKDDDINCYDLYCPPTKKRKKNKLKRNNNNNDNDTFLCLMEVNDKMLTTKSKIFDKMRLKGNEFEINANKIKDVDDMIYFLQTNILKNDCDVFSVICLAENYQINELKMQCIKRLIDNVSIDNFLKTINIFHRFDYVNQSGYKYLIEFGKRNINQLKKTNIYDQLSYFLKCELSGY